MTGPSNGIIKVEAALYGADWPCCEGCKYASLDGCAREAEADASVYLEDGWLCCGVRGEGPSE